MVCVDKSTLFRNRFESKLKLSRGKDFSEIRFWECLHEVENALKVKIIAVDSGQYYDQNSSEWFYPREYLKRKF